MILDNKVVQKLKLEKMFSTKNVYFIPIITTKFAYFASINRSNFIVFLIDSLNIFLCTLLTQCLWKNKRILGSELSKELRDLHSNKKIG